MAGKYYYLVSSLPRLILDRPSPITRDGFLSECVKWMDADTYSRLASIDSGDLQPKEGDGAVVSNYKSFDLYLREELAEVRKIKREGGREKISLFVKDIFDRRDPLLMEKGIQEKRWDFLDAKEFDCDFDINLLQIYYLKIQLLERLAKFNKDRGMNIFSKSCEVENA